MQNKFHLIFLTGIVFISFSCRKENIEKKMNNCNCYEFPVSDVYDYPITPSSPEWAEYGQDSACQMPLSVLNEISTAGLLQSVINHDGCLSRMHIRSDIHSGYGMVRSKMNAVRELEDRDDIFEVVLNWVQHTGPCCVDEIEEDNSTSVSPKFIFYFVQLEFIQRLAFQEKVLSKANQLQLKDLISEMLRYYNEYKTTPYYEGSDVNIVTSLTAMSVIMRHAEYALYLETYNTLEYLRTFEQYSGYLAGYKESTINEILNHAKQFAYN
jgi:hypothetical protein